MRCSRVHPPGTHVSYVSAKGTKLPHLGRAVPYVTSAIMTDPAPSTRRPSFTTTHPGAPLIGKESPITLSPTTPSLAIIPITLY